jgi:hypothetical protein
MIMLRDGAVLADRRVPDPYVAGTVERPSEASELEEIFRETYYEAPKEAFN